MGRNRAEGRVAGSRLFLMYAGPSLLLVLVLGFVLARNDEGTGKALGLDQGRDQAAVIEQTAIAPAIGTADLSGGLSPHDLAGVRQATDLAIFSGSVRRLRLRSFSGKVVFSDDGSGGADAVPATDPAFRSAANGRASVAVVRDPSDDAAEVIRILEPIVPNSSGQATGILEVYLPYAAIAHKVHDQLNRTYLRLAIGLGAMYLILALISWSTTRRLRRHAAERHHQALHDSLTGLPNREWFRTRADAAMRRAERGEVGALVLIDLDHFKDVNDTLGHHAGDALLQVVADRLSGSLRTDDTVARLGGDEFGLVLPGVSTSNDAIALIETIRATLAEEIVIESVSLRVEARFGIAMYPEHGTSVEQLLRRADAAMYHGKRGAASIVVYEKSIDQQQRPGLIIQGELRQALAHDELVLYYQPQVDLVTNAIVGVEALARWQHPQRGLLEPIEFVPAAEESGLIEPLTDWVLERALRDQQGWLASGVDWRVSVNVSARNLSGPTFADRVMSILARTGSDPRRLCVEVTETALAANPEAASASVTALSNAGIAISIDDFGTGYTGLWQLRTLVVDEVKIDQAFVSDLITSGQDRSIVLAIIGLSHGLGCTVTAEGVECEAAAQWLRAAGCDSAQGYYFARPAPWPDLLTDRAEVPARTATESNSHALLPIVSRT
jgi:diguanylate cyclase (GGDEF)-like protein